MPGSSDPHDLKSIARRISTRFRTHFHRNFAFWKVRMDPLYQAVGDLLRTTTLPVMDLGCGTGLLCFYLHERGVKTPLHGMDFDQGKIEAARHAAQPLEQAPEFHHGDVRHPWPQVHGNVCLLDVLQYLPRDHQWGLLTKAASHVATGGLLVIRSGLRQDNWRYRFTLGTDWLMNRIRLMKSPPVSYPDKESLEEVLVQAGLRLHSAEPLHEGTPFNNYLLLFTR